MTPSTKIELNHNKIARIEGLDDLARILFPNNKRHQRVFLAIFIELKYADGNFLPDLAWIAKEWNLPPRTLETVRAKMRRMGIIDHVSRFNKRHGYREGWVFSNRFSHTLSRLDGLLIRLRERTHPRQEAKDRDTIRYL
jgi:hypothetical protein